MVYFGTPLSKSFRSNTPGMGIDSMRVSGGRCPFFIVGGLLLVCVMLLCNWWTLATENTELLKQIDEISDQLKNSVDERDKCVTRLGETQEDFKRSKKEVNLLHVELEQQKELKNQKDKFEEFLTLCKSELDSLKKLEAGEKVQLESLKSDKEAINMRVQKTIDENKNLMDEVNKLKEEVERLRAFNIVKETKGTPVNIAELILAKSKTNNEENNTDSYNQKVTDQDNAAEQM